MPTPYIPASDEDRRKEAIEKLQAKQARIADEVQKENDMWNSRFGLKVEGGYRKSRRSRTLKRVQKRKQTRRHRHRHRHRR